MVAFSRMRFVTSVALFLAKAATAGTARDITYLEPKKTPMERLKERLKENRYPIAGALGVGAGVALGTAATREDRDDHETIGDRLQASVDNHNDEARELAGVPDNLDVEPLPLDIDTTTINRAADELLTYTPGPIDTDVVNHVADVVTPTSIGDRLGEHGAAIGVNYNNKDALELVQEMVRDLRAEMPEYGYDYFDTSLIGGDVDTVTIVRQTQELSSDYLIAIFSLLSIGALILAAHCFNLKQEKNPVKLASMSAVAVGVLTIGSAMTCGAGFHLAAMDEMSGAYGCFGGAAFLVMLLALIYNKIVLKNGFFSKEGLKKVGHVIGAGVLISSVAFFYNGIAESFSDISVGGNGGMGEDAIFSGILLFIGLLWAFYGTFTRRRGENVGADMWKNHKLALAISTVGLAAGTGLATWGLELVAEQNNFGAIPILLGSIALIIIPFFLKYSKFSCLKKNQQ